MSSVAITGGATGTGVFTLLAPSTSTNRTLTLPDSTGTVQVSGAPISGTTGSFSGDVTLGSSVLATPVGSAPSYTCRAWVNFNGTGTVAIRASGNVSSITDHGTGAYTVNFTTAMPDANYSASGIAQTSNIANGVSVGTYDSTGVTAGGLRIATTSGATNGAVDCPYVMVTVIR